MGVHRYPALGPQGFVCIFTPELYDMGLYRNPDFPGIITGEPIPE